jgi:hypothetical protein
VLQKTDKLQARPTPTQIVLENRDDVTWTSNMDKLFLVFDFHMDMFVMCLIAMIVHVAYHKGVSQRAQQKQPKIEDGISRYVEYEDCRQPKNGQQTAKQHYPDVTFIHLILLSAIPFERRKGNYQISVFYPGGIFIQWSRRRSADDISKNIKVTIMAGADVMLLIWAPGDAATEMGANIGEHPYFIIIPSHHIQTVIGCSALPAVDFGSRKFKPSRNSNGIIFQRTKIKD